MNVLFLTDALPDERGATPQSRYLHLIEDLSRRHHVFLTCAATSPVDTQRLRSLQRLCAAVEVVPLARRGRLIRLARAVLRRQPLLNGHYMNSVLWRAVRRHARESRIDLVHVEHAHMAAYLDAMDAGRPFKRLLVLHNVGPVMFRGAFTVEDRPLKKLEALLDWLFAARWEPRACRRFDKCVVFSEDDRKGVLSLAPGLDVRVVKYGFKLRAFPLLPPTPQSAETLYIGQMGYAPNRDGARHLCRSILPLILAQRPDARLNVVGISPPADLGTGLPPGAVNVVGFVEDTLPWYRRSAISLVPLRAGSGVRGKILESMALGRPVVSTSLGCEGIEVVHGRDLLIADTPRDFADCAVRLLSDADLWKHIARNGRRFVEERHRWSDIAQDMERLYEEMAQAD